MAYLVSSSPHFSTAKTTKSIMRDVFLALLPAVIAAVFIFGFYPLFMCLLSVCSAVFAEFLFNKMRKQPVTVGDWSAAVTGLLVGLNLPPVVPFYIPIVGSFFAIWVVKCLFGGIGKNFANPAITARIFLILAWGSAMTAYAVPIDLTKGFGEMFRYFSFSLTPDSVQTIAGATPLAGMGLKYGETLGNVSNLSLFLGNVGGCAGEVSALALLIGGIYLVVRKVIKPAIPLIYILTVGILTMAVKGDAGYFLPSILSGGLFLGAIFMATDYSTSPNTRSGQIIYALLLGLLTTVFRLYSTLPEGVSFAILLMNIMTPLIDKYTIPRPFGYKKPVRDKKTVKGKEAVNG